MHVVSDDVMMMSSLLHMHSDDVMMMSSGVRVLVVGTLTVESGDSLDEPQYLGLPELFLQHLPVPLLDCDAALAFINSSNVHRWCVVGSLSLSHWFIDSLTH